MDPNANQQPGMPQQPAPAGGAQQNFELSVGAVFKNCIHYFKENLALILLLNLIPFIPYLGFFFAGLASSGSENIEDSLGLGILAVLGISMLLVIFLGIRVSASISASALVFMRDGSHPTFSEGWKLGAPHFVSVLLISLVSGIIIGLGLLALIVPGIVLALMYTVAIPAAIDRNLGVMDSLKESARLTKGSYGFLLKLIVTYMLIAIVLGFIPILGQIASLVIGMIAALAAPYIYLGLKQKVDGNTAGMPANPMQAVGMPGAAQAQPAPAVPVQAPATGMPTQPVQPAAAPSAAPEAPAVNEQQPPVS